MGLLPPPPYGSLLKQGGPRPKHKNSKVQAERPGMSPAHLALIRKLPCCICGKAPGGQAHHLKTAEKRGVGQKVTDQWTVPLCHDDHINGVERVGSRNEVSWFNKRGINCLWLASALWKATGDLKQMRKILRAHVTTEAPPKGVPHGDR